MALVEYYMKPSCLCAVHYSCSTFLGIIFSQLLKGLELSLYGIGMVCNMKPTFSTERNSSNYLAVSIHACKHIYSLGKYVQLPLCTALVQMPGEEEGGTLGTVLIFMCVQVSASITKLNNSTSAKGKHSRAGEGGLRQWYNDQRTPCCLCRGSMLFLVLMGF